MPESLATVRALIAAEADAARERDKAAAARHRDAELQAAARHTDLASRIGAVETRLGTVEGQVKRGFADRDRDRGQVATVAEACATQAAVAAAACTSAMAAHEEAHRSSLWTATPLAWLWYHRRAVGLLLLGAASAAASPDGREMIKTFGLALLARVAP